MFPFAMSMGTNAHLHQRTLPQAHPHTRPLNVIDTNNKKNTDERDYGPVETDSEAKPYWSRPMVLQERAEREALGITRKDYGTRWRAAFRSVTGNAPKCAPGDRLAAYRYWQKLVAAIRMGQWTAGEHGQLYRQARVWQARAQGLDARFEVVGTRPGRPAPEDRGRIEMMKVLADVRGMARGKAVNL